MPWSRAQVPDVHLDLPADQRPPSHRRASPWLDRGFALLWVAAVLVPLIGIASAGIATWRSVQEEAASRIERTVELLRQHALRAFDAQEAILAAVARVAAGRTAEDLRGDEALHALLADLAGSSTPTVSGVLVTDAAWRIASASWEFPARPVDLSDRDYVRILQEGGERRAVGEPVVSRPMGWHLIPVARRLAPGDERAGPSPIVVSSFQPEALTAFYASVAETPEDVIALLREDGTLLARQPPADAAVAREGREAIALLLATQLADLQRPRWVVSPLDERQRLFAARRVGEWPVVVAYALDRGALVESWRRRMLAPTIGGIAAILLLLGLTATAQRGALLHRQQAETRAEAETQLARAGRAAAIGLLTAGLAHDVKNLVQAVRSGARIMQRRAEDPEEVRRCAELLGDAAERGGRLVDAMLAFARGSNAETEEQMPSFDPGPALTEIAELLGRTLGSRWRVVAQVPPGLPAARGDRAGFEAAIVNLAANARDAMPDGGSVTISAWTEDLEEPLEEAGLRAGRHLVAAVRDTGEGMDEATLTRLGEPFFTTKPPGLGNGLGLATVRGFCAHAGGALRFDSMPGRGTMAAIWLPLA